MSGQSSSRGYKPPTPEEEKTYQDRLAFLRDKNDKIVAAAIMTGKARLVMSVDRYSCRFSGTERTKEAFLSKSNIKIAVGIESGLERKFDGLMQK